MKLLEVIYPIYKIMFPGAAYARRSVAAALTKYIKAKKGLAQPGTVHNAYELLTAFCVDLNINVLPDLDEHREDCDTYGYVYLSDSHPEFTDFLEEFPLLTNVFREIYASKLAGMSEVDACNHAFACSSVVHAAYLEKDSGEAAATGVLIFKDALVHMLTELATSSTD
jgi:hypothetical protein